MLIFSNQKKLNISTFPVVKMAANYVKIYRVGGLDAGFQQVQLVQKF